MFCLEDETVLFLYCWTFNEMQIPATRDRREGSRRISVRSFLPLTPKAHGRPPLSIS